MYGHTRDSVAPGWFAAIGSLLASPKDALAQQAVISRFEKERSSLKDINALYDGKILCRTDGSDENGDVLVYEKASLLHMAAVVGCDRVLEWLLDEGASSACGDTSAVIERSARKSEIYKADTRRGRPHAMATDADIVMRLHDAYVAELFSEPLTTLPLSNTREHARESIYKHHVKIILPPTVEAVVEEDCCEHGRPYDDCSDCDDVDPR